MRSLSARVARFRCDPLRGPTRAIAWERNSSSPFQRAASAYAWTDSKLLRLGSRFWLCGSVAVAGEKLVKG